MVLESEDIDLLEAITEGSEVAFRQIIQRYQKPLKRFTLGMIYSSDAAEEIVHETFVELWMSYISKQKKVENLQALLFQIVRNRAINHIRIVKIKRFISLSMLSATALTSENPYQQLCKKGEISLVLETLRRLPAKDREILLLIYGESLQMHETAKILKISEEAVNSRLRRARARLKELLPESILMEWSLSHEK